MENASNSPIRSGRLASRPIFPRNCSGGERYEAVFEKTSLHRDVADALADLGYFFAKFNIDVEADTKTKAAYLAIDILDEGPRAVLGDIKVTGNKVNSRDDIVKYLGLQPGEPWNRSKSLHVGYRLWRSARFAKAEVNPVAPAAGKKGVTLRIAVVECDRAAALQTVQRRRAGSAEVSRLDLQSGPVARRHGLAGPRRGRQVDGGPLAKAWGDGRRKADGQPRGRSVGVCHDCRGGRDWPLLRAAAAQGGDADADVHRGCAHRGFRGGGAARSEQAAGFRAPRRQARRCWGAEGKSPTWAGPEAQDADRPTPFRLAMDLDPAGVLYFFRARTRNARFAAACSASPGRTQQPSTSRPPRAGCWRSCAAIPRTRAPGDDGKTAAKPVGVGWRLSFQAERLFAADQERSTGPAPAMQTTSTPAARSVPCAAFFFDQEDVSKFLFRNAEDQQSLQGLRFAAGDAWGDTSSMRWMIWGSKFSEEFNDAGGFPFPATSTRRTLRPRRS